MSIRFCSDFNIQLLRGRSSIRNSVRNSVILVLCRTNFIVIKLKIQKQIDWYIYNMYLAVNILEISLNQNLLVKTSYI